MHVYFAKFLQSNKKINIKYVVAHIYTLAISVRASDAKSRDSTPDQLVSEILFVTARHVAIKNLSGCVMQV